MRKIVLALLLALLLLVPRTFKASELEQNPDGAVSPRYDEAAPPQNPSALQANGYPESDDDIFSSGYEREMLSRRFFQKALPPLKPREKIIWAFKTSGAGILL
ncbi:MAG: hypothetical protein MUF02_02370 [Acidobacteria bacterium]|jgi:hypothetical protein|nr:hypothetical protein [Acidobacteriota bacterium]